MATLSYFKGYRCEEKVFHKTVTIKLRKTKSLKKINRTFIIVIEHGISNDLFSATKQLLSIKIETK